MITAGHFKKGIVITLDGAHWIVEDYHIHKTAQRRPVLQTRLRNMKTGHVVERGFDESDRFEQPELHQHNHQFLYQDGSDYVFMDAQTFDQVPVPAAVVGEGKWLLREGTEFMIRLLDGRPAEIVLPPTFVGEVVETAEPASGHGAHVPKDARLDCGLTIKVPLFIKVGEHVRIDTTTHKYLGKESGKH
jgi:elongation factor P